MKITDMSKLIKVFTVLFTWIFLLSLGWMFFNCVFNNLNDLVHFEMKTIVPISILILLILMLVTAFTQKVLLKKHFFIKNKKIFFILSFIIVFIFQLIVARKTYFDCGWDAGTVIRSGKALVENPSEFGISYYQTFPNNILMVFLYKKIYLLSLLFSNISYEFLLIIISTILVDLSVIFALLIVSEFINKTAFIPAYIFSIVILMFSSWIAIPYSDTYSIIFPVLNIYLYLRIKKCTKVQNKIILSFLIGIFSIIGYQIKPTAIISMIAIIISCFIYNLKDKKSCVMSLLIISCIVSSAGAGKLIYNKKVNRMQVNGVSLVGDTDKQMPMTHFLMMGINENYIEGRGTLYGAYNGDDYAISFGCATKEERINTNLAEYKERLKKLGISGYIKYISNKGNWMLSDGTFYYGGEGSFAISECYESDNTAKLLQSYFNFDGENYKVNAYFRQAVWTLVLFFIVIPIIFIKKDFRKEEVFVIRMCIFGIIVFLLLFEGRSRYLLNHIPLFIVLASYGFNEMYKLLNVLYRNRVSSNLH